MFVKLFLHKRLKKGIKIKETGVVIELDDCELLGVICAEGQACDVYGRAWARTISINGCETIGTIDVEVGVSLLEMR